jgi:ankyrin repeat protein
LVERLVKQGADVNVKTSDGHTPLHFAAQGNCDKVIEVLIKNGADVNARSSTTGSTALFHLLYLPDANMDAVNLLLARKADVGPNKFGATPLHYLARMGTDVKCLYNLVAAGADVNEKDFSGETPLHNLLWRYEPPMPLLKGLLALGADVNIQDSESQGLLFPIYTMISPC